MGMIGFAFFLNSEIIRISQISQKRLPFAMKRDIFSAFKLGQVNRTRVPQNMRPETKPREGEKRDLIAEIRRSVVYEGFIGKGFDRIALISVNGEAFTVRVGETIMEKIKVIKIDSKRIKVEVESQTVEINLKEDE